MSSFSDHQKSIDRISNLPTNLIAHILSLLSTEDAVRTSVLNTHWNRQWTSIARLDFKDGSPFRIGSAETTRASFVNFVNRALLLNATCLDLFRLNCFQNYGEWLTEWLSAALSRHVRHIDLSFSIMGGNHLLPDCIFSSKTLVVLKLGMGIVLRVPNLISLVSLKILQFNSVTFEKSESLSRLVSSCPVLEELVIEGNICESMNVINISSFLLKRLILVGLYIPRYSEMGRPLLFEFVLNTPSLQYLEHAGSGQSKYRIETLHCIDEAHLTAVLPHVFNPDWIQLVHSMADLAEALCNVRILCLYVYALEAFHRASYELPTFLCLTVLKIDCLLSNQELRLLIALLQSSPQLASLSFGVGRSYGAWKRPTNVPFCMQYNLKLIEVNGLWGMKRELSIVEYLLENTDCLEELRIPRTTTEKDAEVLKKVSMFPRASDSCNIVLT